MEKPSDHGQEKRTLSKNGQKGSEPEHHTQDIETNNEGKVFMKKQVAETRKRKAVSSVKCTEVDDL